MDILVSTQDTKVLEFLMNTLSKDHNIMLAEEVRHIVENQLSDILNDPYLLLEFDLIIVDKGTYHEILKKQENYDLSAQKFGIFYLLEAFNTTSSEEIDLILNQTALTMPISKKISPEELLVKIQVFEKILKERRELLRYAYYDPLTGLKNRRTFMENFERYFQIYQTYAIPFCLAVIDLDHFKLINDTYGHAKGDEVLKIFADVLNTNCRKTDVVARIGGEEFAIVFPDISLDQAHLVLERIRQEFTDRFKNTNMHITVSAGLASMSEQLNSPEILFRQADNLLYHSKTQGRNQVSK